MSNVLFIREAVGQGRTGEQASRFHERNCDDQTRTIKGNGLLFQLKDTRGGVILQWTGATLERPGVDLEVLAGNVNGVKSFLKDPEAFLGATCRALGTELIN